MVNPAITAALIAAFRQEAVEQKIEGRLKKANATSPPRAIELPLDDKHKKLVEQALAAGTIKRTAEGRYYLHEAAVGDRKEGQGFMALLILLAIGSLIASTAVLLDWAGR